MSDAAYEINGLPLNPVRPGSTILLVGPEHVGTRDVGFRLLDGSTDEGSIVVSTDKRARRIIEDCERLGIDTSVERTKIVDCVDSRDSGLPAGVHHVSGPSDLTGIGMRASDAFQQLYRGKLERVRMGFFSLSTLLLFGTLRNVSRFVHVFASRIDQRDGLAVFHLNPAIHDTQEISTLGQFCRGRIDVRSSESGRELRARGLSDQPDGWVPF